MPRQLPLAARGFVGRTKHLAELDALLQADSVVISALDGTAGIGKTTLAVHWAHRVQHHFPDGTLHTNLRGYGPGDPATPAEVLDEFLLALGIPPERVPTGTEAKAALFRSVLAGKRVLMVLDNANAVNQVRPLLPGSPGCLVLITSRASLSGLVVNEGANRVTLDLLTAEESANLVRSILGARADAEPDAMGELIRQCAYLPLALRVAAGRAATQQHLELSELVADIATDRWDALSIPDDQDTAVQAVFDWSYRRLTAEHARAYRRLGLHPGPEMSLHAAAAVIELPLPHARKVLDALAGVHLIEPTSPGRYRFHDLLHAHAADHAQSDDDREVGHRSVLEWYAHHAIAAALIMYPTHNGWHPAFAEQIRVAHEIRFSHPSDVTNWLEAERANLVACAHQAERHRLPKLTSIISYSTAIALGRLGYRDDMLRISTLGLAAAEQIDDIRKAHALVQCSEAHVAASQWHKALDYSLAALELAGELNDEGLQSVALNEIAIIHYCEGRLAQAEVHLRSALPKSVGVQNGRMEAVVEGNLSRVYSAQGDFDRALRHAERGLSHRRHAGDRPGEAAAMHHIALACQGKGMHDRVIGLCESSLEIYTEHRFPTYIAETLDTLATSLLFYGDIARATECWREAVHIFDAFDDRRAEGVRQRLNDMQAPPSTPVQ